MNPAVERDMKFEKRFIPTIRNIVGPHLLEPAPLDLDMAEATDLIVLRARDMRIGCRVRRSEHRYAERYPWDFTIRSKRISGATTELEKIVNGWGDWLFYGHEHSETSIAILRWFLVDLAAWRSHMIRRPELRGQDKPNPDGETFFRPYDLRKFGAKPPICVASSHPIPNDSSSSVVTAGRTA